MKMPVVHDRIPIRIALIGVAWTVPARAIESPVFEVTVEQTNTIYTATPASSTMTGFKPHINFPYMKDRGNGSLVVEATVGQTQTGKQFGITSYSYNGGLTWSTPITNGPSIPHAQLIRPSGQDSHGVRQQLYSDTAVTQWNGTRYLSTNGATSWTYLDSTFNSDVSLVHSYSSFSDIVDDGNGTLLTLAQAQRPGVGTLETALFASTDSGNSWNRRSTVAAHTFSNTYGIMGSEGPSEGTMVKLDNGDLLAVVRTGQPFPNTDINATAPPLFWAMSSDHGNTWSPPKSLGVAGVMPLLRKLNDGSVALTYGRYGGKILMADHTGRRWGTPITMYDGPTSGHVELRRGANGKYVYVYDQSSFYPPSWNSSPPAGYVYDNDQSANLKAAIVNIQNVTPAPDFPWAYEFHGDMTPDQADASWSAYVQGGAAYFWAQQARDYLRLDTLENGVSRAIYYTQNASNNSMWSRMDFGDGVVADIRARITRSSTSEGSANLFMGDGANGYVALELTGAGVNIEGLGGNAGQVEYLESNHAGFDTAAWHDYRLVIAPGTGGIIRADLFLDGNYAAPILTQMLNSDPTDEIRIGDQTATNNGTMEIDFLRYARLNTAPGDADHDGDVDLSDLGALATNYGAARHAEWSMGDFDFDGDVDLNDLGALATNYGAGAAQAFADFQTLSIPEPASMAWMVVFLFSRPACGARRSRPASGAAKNECATERVLCN